MFQFLFLFSFFLFFLLYRKNELFQLLFFFCFFHVFVFFSVFHLFYFSLRSFSFSFCFFYLRLFSFIFFVLKFFAFGHVERYTCVSDSRDIHQPKILEFALRVATKEKPRSVCSSARNCVLVETQNYPVYASQSAGECVLFFCGKTL